MEYINESAEYEKYEDGLVQGISDSIGELKGGTPPPMGGDGEQPKEKKPETHKERAIVPQKNNGGGDSSDDDSLLPSDEKSDNQQQDQGSPSSSSKKDISDMNAQEASESAQQSADKAQKSADNARKSAIGAQNAADSAKNEAESAKSQFGEDSQEYKNAKSLADEAQEAANDAQDAADQAQDSADKARDDAKKASDAAKNGDTKGAQSAAQSAKENADDAKNAEADSKMNSWFAKDAADEAKESNGGEGGNGGNQKKDVSNMNAGEAAKEAQDAADRAQDAANDAQEAANDAQDIADQANENAEKAKRKFGEDSQEYKNAKSKADKAQKAADKAQDAANDAQDAANEAQDAADAAKDAADKGDTQGAKDNAKKAQGEDEKAQDSADKAVDFADDASEAGNSGQKSQSGQNNQQGSQQSGEQGEQQSGENGDESNDDSDREPGNGEGGERGEHRRPNGYSNGDMRKIRNRNRKNNPNESTARIHHSQEPTQQKVVGEMIKQSDVNARLGESLKRSGFSDEDVKDLMGELSGRPIMDEDSIKKLRDDIVRNKPKSELGKLFTKIKMSEATINDLWQEIIQKFLEANTMFANRKHKIADRNKIRWGNKRTLAHEIVQPYHPKNDAAPQNINVFVDTSTSVNRDTVELFADTIVSCCDKLEYSGITLIPFATTIDTNAAVYLKVEDVKKDRGAAISKVLDMVENNEAGGGTRVTDCVDYILKNVQTDRFSVWLFLTDGEFNAKPLSKLIPIKTKLMLVIYNYNIMKKFEKKLKWCVDPNFDQLSKCYIELDEECKKNQGKESPFYS